MNRVPRISLILAILLSVMAYDAVAESEEEERVREATIVLTEIMDIPEEGIPAALLEGAHGLAVMPNVLKAGFVIGGKYGKGILVVRKDDGSWSRPVFLTITGGSIGWQIGAQATDAILVFNTSRSVDDILEGKFTLGADASVAAGPVGRSAAAATDEHLKAEIYSYSRARGLFAGISFEGAKLGIDNEADNTFYGTADSSAKEIVSSRKLKTPKAARDFMEQAGKAPSEK